MAHSGLLRSTPESSLYVMLLLWMYMEPPLDTQSSSLKPTCMRCSGTGAAQCPGLSVRSGMAIGARGSDLAAGCTLVKPTRRAPCHLAVLPPNFRQIISWIFSGRLLNTRPFLNVVALLVASLKPWLRETSSPTAWQWKVRGPRQERPHQWYRFFSTTAEGRGKKVDAFMNKVVEAMLASDGISVKLKPGKSVFNENLDGNKAILPFVIELYEI